MDEKNIESDKLKDVFDALRTRLNEHGYCFQYASLDFIKNELPTIDGKPWIFQTSEFPVQTLNKDKGTRIDFVLKSKYSTVQNFLLLFECKRSNPALKNWCFLRLPYVRKGRDSERFFAEVVTPEPRIKATGKVLYMPTHDEFYHLAIEVKSGEVGNKSGKSYGEIEDAATQICRGLNGLIDLYAKYPQMLPNAPVIIIPIILTTANILAGNLEIENIDLQSGNLNTLPTLNPKDWIYYQYHQSPALKHNFPAVQSDNYELPYILDRDYIRTIPVVSANGISNFLKQFDHECSIGKVP